MPTEVSKEDRLLAALSYPFWPLAFLILNLSPTLKSQPFLRHHAFQGFFLGMTLWVGTIVLGTVAGFLGRYLWPIGVLYYLFSKLLGLATLLVIGWSSYKAWRGECHELPVVGRFTRDFLQESLAPTEGAAAPAEESTPVTRDLVERVPSEQPPTAPTPRRRSRTSNPGAPPA